MINTLIFDFGDVFINLDKASSIYTEMRKVRNSVHFPKKWMRSINPYETGRVFARTDFFRFLS